MNISTQLAFLQISLNAHITEAASLRRELCYEGDPVERGALKREIIETRLEVREIGMDIFDLVGQDQLLAPKQEPRKPYYIDWKLEFIEDDTMYLVNERA